MTQPEQDTRTRLLDAAEKLFGENGIGATSLRAITAEAGANLASIHYHFGSKDVLLVEVFARRIEPINAERLRRLDATLADAPDDLDGIVRAFVSPALELLHRPDLGGANITHLMGRLYSEPIEVKFKILHMFEEVASRFTRAIGQCLPHLSPAELFWRFHYMVGAMAFIMVSSDIVEARSRGMDLNCSVDDSVARLVRFIAGGLRAPGGGNDTSQGGQA